MQGEHLIQRFPHALLSHDTDRIQSHSKAEVLLNLLAHHSDNFNKRELQQSSHGKSRYALLVLPAQNVYRRLITDNCRTDLTYASITGNIVN